MTNRTGLTKPNKQRQHPGRVCHTKLWQPTFNRFQSAPDSGPVSKSRQWLTQLHNYRPNIATRLIGQPHAESGYGYRMRLICFMGPTGS